MASVVLGYLEDLILVSVPLCGVALINVGQEGEDTDDLAFAFFVVFLLPDQLEHIGLDVSFAKQVVGEIRDASGVARSIVNLLVSGRFSSSIVPVIDSGITTDLEAACELSLDGRVHLGKLYLALELGGDLVPLRLESLAVTAPGCIELYKPDVFRAEHH